MSASSRRPIVIVDTGPLVALVSHEDEHHLVCTKWLEEALRERRTLVIPALVVTEVCYLLSKTAGSEYESIFLEGLAETPATFRFFYPGRQHLARMGQLVCKYSDLPLGAVDASVVVAAEHFGTSEVATIDGRMAATVKIKDSHPMLKVP